MRIALVFGLLLAACAPALRQDVVMLAALPQIPNALVLYGYTEDSARTVLERDWKVGGDQLERAYCGVPTFTLAVDGGVMYGLKAVRVADNIDADHTAIWFSCQPAEIEIHVHPPQTCHRLATGGMTCLAGGPDAYQCAPSALDIASLLESHRLFAVLQCGPAQLVFYKPAGKHG